MLSCPLPLDSSDRITLAHGGGGRRMHRLLQSFFGTFGTVEPHDGAVVEGWAFSTDSYVVRPLFFPGGDIGSLAVHGTVNDLAMCGARAVALSVGLILEEGLPMEVLGRVVESMQRAAAACGVRIVTGDTKVVDRGHGDGIFINTAGLGRCCAPVAPDLVRAGDAVLASGDLGRHGIAIMAAREGLEFETRIESDSAPLVEPALALLEAGLSVHCMRDLTRGGLTSALVELAESSGLAFEIEEASVPVHPEVEGACELLGLDPMSVANEGRFVVVLPEAEAGRALEILRAFPVSSGAVRLGTVAASPEGRVRLRTRLGSVRPVDMPSGEQLPRIC